MSDFRLIPLQRRSLEGSFMISRGIPSRHCRQIGPWCFFDKLKEANIDSNHSLNVGPHPHIGLQILSWIIEGEVQHQDSIGHKLIALADDLNFMTAGRGIVHTEDTPKPLLESGNSSLHLLQFWIALPKAFEEVAPDFVTMQQKSLPVIPFSCGEGKLIVGEYQGQSSPLKTYSPIFAMELILEPGETNLALESHYEYGITLIEGDVIFRQGISGDKLYDEAVTPEVLPYFTGVNLLKVDIKQRARFIIFGGLPLEEPHYIWWNYVSSDPEKIAHCHQLWQSGDHFKFPKIQGESRENLVAPDFPKKLIFF